MIYIEALNDPLSGWVKDFKPTTIHDYIERTRDLTGATSKNKFTPKPPVINKPTGPRQFDRGKGPLDEATRRELRRKKLFFTCKESWKPVLNFHYARLKHEVYFNFSIYLNHKQMQLHH
jgi:hypothetical protein